MRASYRLQLSAQFGFAQARELVPYLSELGVSHLYLSPIMRARSGSTHGYDVVDPTRISDELGGEQEFRQLAAAAHDAGLGVLVDFVPNHMAAIDENPFWRDPALRERFFDIDPRSGWHRRFFTIDELAGVRVELPEVFDAVHATIIGLVAEGLVDGLRIDHIDGLADPAGYLERLAKAGVELIWVEKILEPGEQLRAWPVQGTTGYEFASDVTALFVDPAGEAPLTSFYARFTGVTQSFEEVAAAAKLEQAREAFEPELDKLRDLCGGSDLDVAVSSLRVYRPYVRPYAHSVEAADRSVVATLPSRLRRVLLLEEDGHEEFVVRFQQTTGPVMAKGVEDTAFYRYLRLCALNEVGGNPGRFSLSVEDFHAANAARAQRLPRQMLASQTHDTKRSGDVRARIGALAERASEWISLVEHWHAHSESLRSGPGPDANEEYLIYQTLVGAWPIEPERLLAYLEKALREAKVNTAWGSVNEEWERSVLDFAAALYDHAPFRERFDPFVARIAAAGERASLGALALRLTCPGFADIYQGDELWALNLVDPDNRRAVDWAARREALARVLAGEPEPGDRKLGLIHAALALRARRPDAFAGDYTPLPAPADVCAFTRGSAVAVVVALRSSGDPQAVAPPDGAWHELLSPGDGYDAVRLLERA
jgi:(1->4)-alpha-D-glucan 1-alpha-D-glucosylmutase